MKLESLGRALQAHFGRALTEEGSESAAYGERPLEATESFEDKATARTRRSARSKRPGHGSGR
ncbi:hypothetical protein [Deinococcus yavapaiensis]|uniref:Uncharacterized protein n=1 Tax=Deinococcus yavapaiensis KR-236 TaxID=694435 RepID=A0A318SL96_9DEIO|nr:hypothetical protein [Deinococcus yavapaiensis]PYE53322.1 hypothetical protein DES52_10995 [Deinococcus yavapaiensis KR-236]